MSLALEPNRIPAPPIMDVVRGYLEREGIRAGAETYESYPITLLAERADMNPDTLMKTLEGRMHTIDFDVADRLLCVMGLFDLWLSDLRDLYQSACLEEGPRKFQPMRASGSKVCERQGCSNRFEPEPRAPKKRFCCRKCYAADYRAKERGGYTLGPYGPGCALSALVCRNGHQRTFENTRYNRKGRRYCLECKRARDRANQLVYRARNAALA